MADRLRAKKNQMQSLPSPTPHHIVIYELGLWVGDYGNLVKMKRNSIKCPLKARTSESDTSGYALPCLSPPLCDFRQGVSLSASQPEFAHI